MPEHNHIGVLFFPQVQKLKEGKTSGKTPSKDKIVFKESSDSQAKMDPQLRQR
jgi:hypothetical protein